MVATIKPWNIKIYSEIIKYYPGKWYLITNEDDLTLERVKFINPKYIFFPHWSNIVPKEILNLTTCICFHETDLPFGKGGSPLQNLISRGYKETVISAIKMIEKLDAGPIYLKESLHLEGLAEEIFIRAAYTIAQMIKRIVTENPKPQEQTDKVTIFKRRTPDQSRITGDIDKLYKLFDHIRMLDADGYPKAFIEINGFRYEFSRPALKTDGIIADVCITKIEDKAGE